MGGSEMKYVSLGLGKEKETFSMLPGGGLALRVLFHKIFNKPNYIWFMIPATVTVKKD